MLEGRDILIERQQEPICNVPAMHFGNMPADGGELLFSDSERIELLQAEPKAKKYIRRFMGAQEFINNKKRWCLWLKGIPPSELGAMKPVLLRVQKVKEIRENSSRAHLADYLTYLPRSHNQMDLITSLYLAFHPKEGNIYLSVFKRLKLLQAIPA